VESRSGSRSRNRSRRALTFALATIARFKIVLRARSGKEERNLLPLRTTKKMKQEPDVQLESIVWRQRSNDRWREIRTRAKRRVNGRNSYRRLYQGLRGETLPPALASAPSISFPNLISRIDMGFVAPTSIIDTRTSRNGGWMRDSLLVSGGIRWPRKRNRDESGRVTGRNAPGTARRLLGLLSQKISVELPCEKREAAGERG